MFKASLISLIVLSAHAIEPFQEQTPLQMATPNINKEHTPKWIPLSPVAQKTPITTTKIPNKTIDETIKNQIQKKMHSLLNPLKENEDE